jgi:hypothetical protein
MLHHLTTFCLHWVAPLMIGGLFVYIPLALERLLKNQP